MRSLARCGEIDVPTSYQLEFELNIPQITLKEETLMTEPVIPDFYESISQEDINTEEGEPVVRPQVYNPDIFPFPSLGGQRFEILSYLLLLTDPRFEDASITLVKVSGDRGRDLLIHRRGKLLTIIQCKNYGKPLDKSALLHELVKIALHNYRAPYIHEDLLEYQIWATTGFTDPAEELINTWADKNWSESDIYKAFELCRKKYAAFKNLTWDECKEYLEQQFPRKISITKVDGIVLTKWLRHNSPLLEQFFTVQVVMSKNDTEEFLNNSGLRHVPETDISLILDSLKAFPSESRHYIGSFVMGLTPQHYSLMTQDELRDFSLNCSRATISNASILIGAITRYVAERSHTAFSSMTVKNGLIFLYVLLRVMTDRVLQKAKSFVPSLLLMGSPFKEIQDSFSREDLSFVELLSRRIAGLWHESLFAEQQYKSDISLEENDPKEVFYALQLGFAKQLKQEFESREQFENALRSDFYSNIGPIRNLDSELRGLVPERFMVVGDTRGALEDKKLMDQFVRSIQALEKNRATNRPANEPEQIAGRPRLERVTWSRLSYKGETYFRGFEAGLVFYGSNFSKELEITHRRVEETLPLGRDYFWQKPNTLSFNYAEIATDGDELSSPLSYSGVEFCIRNSVTDTSDWITFDYPFDWERLSTELDQCENSGQTLYADERFAEAIEPLGRAAFFADRLLSISAERSVQLRNLWHSAIEAAETAKLRFRQGKRVKLVSGQHAGERGEITKLMLRCAQPYEIRLDPKEEVYIFASDNEVESDN